MIFRIRFKVMGGHVHCGIFASKAINQTFAKAGDLCFTKGDEFKAFVAACPGVEFLGEEKDDNLKIATANDPQ